MKKAIILIVLLLVLFGLASLAYRSAPATSQAGDPVEVVQNFFETRDRSLIGPELSDRLDQTEGYDPVYCAQDLPSSVEFSLGPVTANTAEVIVAENFSGAIREVRVGVVKNAEGDWQIEQITCPATSELDFEKTGNLAKNNPGLEPNLWYLIFDEPGSPAAQTKLTFGENSICAQGVENNTCDPAELAVGSRVKVLGQSIDGAVRVFRLEPVESSGS